MYVFTVIWFVFKSLTVKPIANVITLLDNKPGGLERSLKRHKGLGHTHHGVFLHL